MYRGNGCCVDLKGLSRSPSLSLVNNYDGLPVEWFAAVLFKPEHHRDGVVRLAGLYITGQSCPLPRHPLYRLHRYCNTLTARSELFGARRGAWNGRLQRDSGLLGFLTVELILPEQHECGLSEFIVRIGIFVDTLVRLFSAREQTSIAIHATTGWR